MELRTSRAVRPHSSRMKCGGYQQTIVAGLGSLPATSAPGLSSRARASIRINTLLQGLPENDKQPSRPQSMLRQGQIAGEPSCGADVVAGERNPGADMAAGEPSCGADAAVVSPVLQMRSDELSRCADVT